MVLFLVYSIQCRTEYVHLWRTTYCVLIESFWISISTNSGSPIALAYETMAGLMSHSRNSLWHPSTLLISNLFPALFSFTEKFGFNFFQIRFIYELLDDIVKYLIKNLVGSSLISIFASLYYTKLFLTVSACSDSQGFKIYLRNLSSI